MGYRSEVRIAMTREAYDEFLGIMDSKNGSVFSEYPLIGSDIKPGYFEEEGNSVVFGWDSIKWYDGLFRDVTNVSDALAEISANGYPYEFCRVGESWDDIELNCVNDNEELELHVSPSTAIDIYGN